MAKAPTHEQAWFVVARDSFRAANVLLRQGQYRSSVNRSYYAAFSAIVGALPPTVPKPTGLRTPRHLDLPKFVEVYLTQLPIRQRKTIRGVVEKLYASRIAADYNERRTTDKVVARERFTEAGIILRLLGV